MESIVVPSAISFYFVLVSLILLLRLKNDLFDQVNSIKQQLIAIKQRALTNLKDHLTWPPLVFRGNISTIESYSKSGMHQLSVLLLAKYQHNLTRFRLYQNGLMWVIFSQPRNILNIQEQMVGDIYLTFENKIVQQKKKRNKWGVLLLVQG